MRSIARVWIGVVAAVALAGPAQADEVRDKVVGALLETYVHGVDEKIANERVGAEGLAVLHQLLADPTFPRRDNVVAFLTYLGNNRSALALNTFLRNPPASPEIPEEDRALLLAPHALGEIANRGYSLALRVLIVVTRNNSKGGVLAAAAARSLNPDSLRDDMLTMAVRGLGRSSRKAAQARLQAIASGRAVPAPGGRRLGSTARATLKQMAEERRRARASRPGTYDRRSPATGVGGASLLDAQSHNLASGGGADLDNVMLHDSGLDYVNHVDHTNPMSDARLDEILADASVRVGREDFGGDTACCVHFHRKTTGGSFGTPGDGLDIVDTDVKMLGVLANQAARVKVVRLINWCGSPGTNIIGCGYVGAFGTTVVRYGDAASEGALWIHEYGHNVGLGHNTANTRLVMYPVINHNDGLTPTECAKYHAPSTGARAQIVSQGQCVQENLEEGLCGNGVVEAGEACDFDDLRGARCADFGYDGGRLGCAADCTFDSTECSLCGNGIREGGEECDAGDLGGATCGDHQCLSGTPRCTTSCSLDLTTCSQCPQCDNDGTCEAGENCEDCPRDCAASGGAQCGNGVCETGEGEDCVTCPQDCNGDQSDLRRRSFCCGFGGDRPVGCGDWRCRSMGFQCTTQTSETSCCGDGQCSGSENGSSCDLDCGARPQEAVCGNGRCEPGETSCSCSQDCGAPPVEICNDGIDNDCDGSVDCNDADNCGGNALCLCAAQGAPCESPGDCCSYECTGKLRRRTCR